MPSFLILPIATLALLVCNSVAPAQAKIDNKPDSTEKSDEPKPPSKLAGKSLGEWIREMKHPDPSVRVKAIQTVPLFLKASSAAVPTLLMRVAERDVSARANAVLALGLVHVEDDQVAAVVRTLADRLGPAENQAIVRYYAAHVLGRFGDKVQPAMTRLIGATADSRSWEIRQAAVEALGGATKDMTPEEFEKTLVALLRSLSSDHCSKVRLAATLALTNIGNKGTAKQKSAVIESFKARLRDPNAVVAVWSHVGVMMLEGVKPDYLNAVAKYLTHAEIMARTNALLALTSLEEKAAPTVADIIKRLDDEEPVVVGMAVWALGEIGLKVKIDQALVGRLTKMTEDKKAAIGVRHEALLAITKIKEQKRPDEKDEDKVKGLWTQFLKDFKPAGDGGVLKKLGGKELKQWIKEITDKDPSIRENAVRTVPYFKVDGRDAVPKLVFVLNVDRDISMRVNVARALGSIEVSNRDVPDVVEVLKKRLRGDKQALVRYQAVASIGRFEEEAKDAVPDLILATKDVAAWEIRYAAVQSLRNVVRNIPGPPDNEVVQAFIAALRDSSAQVRLATVGALGSLQFGATNPMGNMVARGVAQMKDRESNEKVAIWAHLSYMALTEVSDKELDSLARYMESKEVEVRATACQAMGVMGKHARDKLPDLSKALDDKEPQVVVMAIWALGEIGRDVSPGTKAIAKLTVLSKDEKRHEEIQKAAKTAIDKINGEFKPDKK